MSGLTITTLAQQIEDLIVKSEQQTKAVAAWLGGSATGGPNNDGRYPFVDLNGQEILVPSPASFNDMTSGPAAQSAAAKVAAELARDQANDHANRADAQRTLSEAARGAAVEARDLAQQHRNHAGTSEANARYWAELAQGSGQSTSADRAVVEDLAEQVADNAALASQKATAAAASAALAATFDPTLYDKKSDTLAASRLTGVIDIARIPVLPSQLQFVSSGGLANLTAQQQADIGRGSIVTTTDGFRYVYSGSGSKTTSASYTVLADITPAWDSVSDKPSYFPTNIANVSGLQSALDAKAGLTATNTFTVKQTFNGGVSVKDSLTMTGTDPYLRRDSNSAAWVMTGGQGWTDTGAVIVLHGKDHATRPGHTLIYGVDGNATSTLAIDGFKDITMNRRPTFAGATPWDSANLTPGNYAWKAGGNTMTGLTQFRSGSGATTANFGDRVLEVFNDGGGAAMIAFHRSGSFGTYFGLDTDNQLKVGGWSNGAASQPIWTGFNFTPSSKVSWTDTNMDGGAYTVVRRNGDGGGFFTGRLHAYSQTATVDVWNGGIEIQEVQSVGNTQSGHAYAPALTFHWKNVAARSLFMGSDAWLYIGVQGDKGNFGNLGVNRISSDGNELWLQKAKVTKLKIHEYGINAIGNCDVDGGVFIRSNAPTITLQDSDHRSAMIHVNSNRFYVLRGSGTNATGWESVNGGWPLELNLDNNDAYFAGEIWSGTNRWFRVRGSGNGIYWENHGGGFHMSDNDWVRVYNGKNLYCQAQVRANTVVGESDRRLKTNIAPIFDATQKVAALSGVTFDWKRDGSAGMGFIAQEFKQVLPALVTEDADGMMGVEYGPVVALLVEALKETNARVALLEGRV